MIKKIGTGVLVFLFPLLTFAQEFPEGAVPVVPRDLVPPMSTEGTGLTSCFDFYRFGSTPVALTADSRTVSVGSMYEMRGTVKNENAYPLVDAEIYIKVFKQNASPEKNVNGPYVVDFFKVAEHQIIEAKTDKNFTFNWQVPGDAEAGSYRMAAFVVEKGRFNYLGLTFTNDITGGFFNFVVNNGTKGNVYFDKDNATFNTSPYRFAAFIPTVAEDTKDVTVTIPVNNTSASEYKGDIQWTLYQWDGLQDSNIIKSSTEGITVPAGQSQTVSYTVTDTSKTVYYLTGELRTLGGSKSIVAFRFSRQGIDTARLNSTGITEYPAKENATAFACFHSTASSMVENVKVELTVKRNSFHGLFGTLAENSYEGVAPPNIVAISVPLENAPSEFSVEAKLYQDGVLVDSVETVYTCDATEEECSTGLESIIISILAIVVLGGIAVYVLRRKSPGDGTLTPPTT